MIKLNYFLASLLFYLICFFGNAQAQISGTVYLDGNNNGVKDTKEVGYPYMTVKAYTIGNTQVSIATTSVLGAYSLTGLTSGTKYRIEFESPSGYFDGAYGTGSSSSIQFITANATNVNYGLFTPAKCGSDPNPRLIGTNAMIASGSTTKSVISWRYQTDFYAQDHWGGVPIANNTVHPHSEDILGTQVGVPWAMARIVNSKIIAMVPMASPESTFGSGGASGIDAIYMSDYSGTSNAYASSKTLVDFGTLGISVTAIHPIGATQPRFGEYGFGGVTNSSDGKYLYVSNLGKGNIARIDISGVDYSQLPITAPTISNVLEISLPTTYAGFTSGTQGYFRATSLIRHAGEIYVAGTFDGSLLANNTAVRIVILKLNQTNNTFSEVFSYDPTTFLVGNFNYADVPQTRWTAGPDVSMGSSTHGPLQPVVNGFDFDDYGAIVLGVGDRAVYNLNTSNQTGYVISAWPNGSGGYTLENAGTRGPLTTFMSGSTFHDVYGAGPGGDMFFDQAQGHPFLYSGGVLNLPGKSSIAMGFTDPIGVGAFGVRYDRPNDGRVIGGIHLGGAKQFALVGVENVCDLDPIEVGNYVWNDANNNGIQDGNELAIVGVTVQLINSANAVIATAITDSKGYYIFSSDPNRTSTANFIYNIAALTTKTNFKIRVPNISGGSQQSVLAGLYVTLKDADRDVIDNDASTVGVNAEISFTTGIEGENKHDYDFGFGNTPTCTPPLAGINQTATSGSSITLTGTAPTTGSWSAWLGNPSGATLGVTTGGIANVAFTSTASGYYRFIYNTGASCEDTMEVVVTNCNFVPSIITSSCHSNATQNTTADDYITFLLKPSQDSVMAGKKYSVTATQNGNPIGLTLSDGTAATGLYFGYPSPFRTANGTAGQGNITLTITASNGCNSSQTITLTDPGTCSVVTAPCSMDSVTYTYRMPFQTTELANEPLSIPKFDQQGGTRTLTSAKLGYGMGMGTIFVVENRAATAVNANITSTCDGMIDLAGGATNVYSGSFANVTTGVQNYPAGVSVTPGYNSSTWPGDSTAGTNTSTLSRMIGLGIIDYFSSIYVDPTQSDVWVANITNDLATDNDMKFKSGGSTISGATTYTTAVDLANFIGTGNVDLTASTLSGLTTSGGGGNVTVLQRTKAYAEATVTYYFTTQCCGSAGNYVWNDINGNGINDEATSAGINGVSVELWNATSNTLVTSTMTANDGMGNPGYYNFTICTNGDYKVKFPISNSGNNLTTQTSTAATDNNSDADATTGFSPIFTINVNGTGVAKDNMTIDAGFRPCVANAGADLTLNCTTTNGTIGTTSVVGNTYSWLPTTGLSATNIAQPTASPLSTTSYTLTVNGSCMDTVLVTVNTTPPTANAGSTLNLNCTTTSGTIGTASVVGNTYSWLPTTGLSATNIAQPTASPSTTTTYTVTVTGSNGCSATSSVTVNVTTTPPTANAGSTLNLNCTTTSGTIGTTSVVGNTYAWLPSTGLSAANIAQPTASPSTTTTYTVTVTGSNGCSATSSVTVNVNTTAPTAAITGTMTVCNGSTTTLTASGGASYLWSNTDITAATIVGVGTYTVTATAANGCTSTSSASVVNVQGSVGNYVWNDLNSNGLNDEITSAGINGVSVELWNATSNTLVATTTTANDGSSNPGYYNFVICTSGDYKVKFPMTNGVNILTTQTATAATDNNSDANVTNGESPVFTIDVNGTGVAKDNSTIDAGYKAPAKACIGNYVWNDANHDGVQNNNEVGVSGVTVSLLNGTNEAIISTISTDAYGFYQFCNLTAGDYKVKFSLPTNYIFTGQNAPNDATDSDPNILTGITELYTLAPGDSNMTVDAGIYQPLPTTATVGDRVWFDANGDGLQTPGESGVSGITVTLYNCANPTVPVSTTITDANGNYLFENVLPGNYKVGFSTPIGMVLTTQSGAVSATDNSDADPMTERTACFPVVGGDHITYVDAGLKLKPNTTASLGDKVWNDANQNGIQDPNETGVQGVTVTLYDATGTTVISTTETNGLGNYGFNGIAAGCYVVGFSLPAGYTRTIQNAGTDTSKNSDANAATGMTNQICIAAGQNNPTIDAGIYNAANTNSIGDKVWYDVNHNGLQDPSEYGYPGVVVTLYDCTSNTIIATTSTNANGNYLFDGIANGNYYVDFGFVTGYQFTGANADVAGILGENNSDANPSNGLTNCVTLVGNTNITSVDAGIYPGNTRNATSSLGDIVWTDANNNGLQDNGETGVAGVSVTLYQADGTTILDSAITDGLGNYIFTNLGGGNYVVGFSNLPAGYTFTTQSGNIEDENNSDANVSTGKTGVIALGLGEDKMSVDAGIVAPTGTVCLGDYVWFDLNNDGIQDANEPAVPGVTVKLYDNNTNTILQTATTNSAGNYLFCGLTNGNNYSVGFENLPTGYIFTTQSGALAISNNSDANPATGRTSVVTLGATNDLTLDAGIYSTTTAVVGNYVWYDEDADGIQDPNEAPISGVLVTMYDNTNTAVASAVTNANGGYLFTNVTPGTYTIGFEGYPSTLVPTTKGTNPSADDDSNVDPITGRTDAFTVTAGSSNLTLDAGYKANPIAGLGNYVWYDANENGLQDASESSISGVLVTLYEADGATVKATAITDGNGAYSFPNLSAGDYVVGFAAPLGMTRTQSVGSLNDPLNSDIDASNKTSLITLVAGTYNPNIDAGFYIGVPLPAKELRATLAIIKEPTKCEVNWYTKEESNTKSFNIERSIDGTTFVSVGNVNARGNTTTRTDYVYNDNIEAIRTASIIYYRIKLTDIDNKYYYSNTISVKPLSNTNSDIVVIYPTPFTNKLMIDYTAFETSDIHIELTDVNGRIILQQMNTIELGLNSILIPGLDALSTGQYYIKIKDINTGEKFIRKLVK